MVPPALVADIGGGTFPAVINILLALRAARSDRAGLPSRHRDDGCDVHLRLARAAPGLGRAAAIRAAEGPNSRAARRAIGSIRRKTVNSSPAARWKIISGSAFTAAIGLRTRSRTTARIRRATGEAVAKIIAGKTADEWRPVLAKADCCVTIVASLEEARAIRISSAAACFEHGFPRRRAQPCRPCRCRSRRNFAAKQEQADLPADKG